jgi:hypothetical protein
MGYKTYGAVGAIFGFLGKGIGIAVKGKAFSAIVPAAIVGMLLVKALPKASAKPIAPPTKIPVKRVRKKP